MPLMLLEVLHLALVLLSLLERVEGSQILSLAGGGVFFARIEPELARLQFPYHAQTRCVG